MTDTPAPDAPLVTLDDLPFEAARAAHQHTSHDPERRARGRQEEFVRDVEELWTTMLPHAEDREDELRALVLDYKANLLKYTLAHLAARSRCVSVLVAGPANFNVRQARKRSATADKRSQELLEWRARARHKIYRVFVAAPESGVISPFDPQAQEKVEQRTSTEREKHAKMVATNKAWRLKDKAKARAQLLALEHAPSLVEEWLAGNRPPYERFELTNILARIKAGEVRAATLERAQQAEERVEEISFEATDARPAGRIFVEEARVQVAFTERCSDPLYRALRSRGFKWSPTRSAFVRQFTPDALYAAKQIVGVAQ